MLVLLSNRIRRTGRRYRSRSARRHATRRARTLPGRCAALHAGPGPRRRPPSCAGNAGSPGAVRVPPVPAARDLRAVGALLAAVRPVPCHVVVRALHRALARMTAGALFLARHVVELLDAAPAERVPERHY